ncbi:LuxR C-terminal-related transcriptional regulator [Halomonas sp. Mc5H-6]|uniref:response regulator transcription factor n=1 Tax=Halomonas sp. Mc5H-6 TaxID=2954500 RepID=UPI00209840F1|nr:LuxR C-terminal-related transcriptional regulator [Halomonas sp. Mc5H-6]MCO7246405.1 LuxR C-terminal-related transcriptional regulator [Halomonas sp. Mc5H-6]
MQITQGNWKANINPERGSLGFTRTEAVDLMLLAGGNTYKEIARATGRSPETVRASLKKGYHKLGVYKAAGAVAEAMKRGWIAPLLVALLVSGINPDVEAMRHRPPVRTRHQVSASRTLARRDNGSLYA